jgi:hypothetical protein
MLTVWFIGIIWISGYRILSDYWSEKQKLMDTHEWEKLQERREKRREKLAPWTEPIILFLQDWSLSVRTNLWDIHDRLLFKSLYWGLMKTAFRLQLTFLNFKYTEDPSKLRRFVAATFYTWPIYLGILCTILEVLLFNRIGMTRAYFMGMFLFYMLLGLVQFWAVEYYKWIAPLWNLHSTEKGKASYERYKENCYTELSKDGRLVPKMTPVRLKPSEKST